MRYNTIAIVGPSTSGKTDASIEIARANNGGLVCCDVLQMYAGFKIGSGTPSLFETQGILIALYGHLHPTNNYFPHEAYASIAAEARRDFISKGISPIFEGCSSNYVRILLNTPPAPEFGKITIFGLFPSTNGLNNKLRARLDKMFEVGIVEEIKKLLDEGMSETLPMKAGIIYKSLVPYVLGNRSYEDAVDFTVKRWEKCFHKQYRIFSEMEGIIPVDVDLAHPEQTLEKLEALISRTF
jgi:tRNA A37 N6-isopentenylltransferase MiaA